ncbi:hypothetical protein NHX12_010261 [Muraenolepis orangiensis]|uniref:Uncharacterized protein n=1 Tax=Muraenolepis orangiensis TaxID=630683 RepID=A0A9Q0DLW6_9TELE|nr:hypothetical protein NHX12_010260 [Muraenolepis orangiensis]KAJ3589416.1 hypothetical protein NHX12_010261 [Muraenolepis orangiensis]
MNHAESCSLSGGGGDVQSLAPMTDWQLAVQSSTVIQQAERRARRSFAVGFILPYPPFARFSSAKPGFG